MKARKRWTIGLAVLLAACSQTPTVSVTREDLFSLEIGRFEDQVALYNVEGDFGIRRTDLAMRDGLFYIADGNGQKVVRYNSYGDLLFMIYNEETNPMPLSLRPMPEDQIVIRWAFTYPLQEPGKIVVDSQKRIYVEDLLPQEEWGMDMETGVSLTNVILSFDNEGRFLRQLGQEGIGGRPFPPVEGIYTSLDDAFVVVCRVPGSWYVYWFDAEGIFHNLIKLPEERIPIPLDRDTAFGSIDMIAAAPDAQRLYVKVNYYRDSYDQSTMMRTGIEPDSSVIWLMRVADGMYEEELLEVPFYESNGKTNSVKIFYSMLGVIRNGRVFLYAPVENGYSLLVLGEQGRWRGFIQVSPDEFEFNAFSLSDDGILSAILAGAWDVKLVWWRTDKFMGGASS
ncbi:MAG: hypothetical protein LBD79_04865 [Treponema sp.]|jgi:hypothetical protein|nr:hypothetical protein [Treponema sp.]